MITKYQNKETDERMKRICSRCGEFFENHRAKDNSCPEMEGRRVYHYKAPPECFEEWVDTPQTASAITTPLQEQK